MVSLLSVLFLRCWSFALFCLWSFEFFTWFRDCLTPTPLPLPRPLPSALPSPPPRLSPHMSLDLSLVFVAHIAWHSFISHFTSIITSHARTHILFFSHSYCTSRFPRCIRRTILFDNTVLSFCRCPTRLHAIRFARLR